MPRIVIFGILCPCLPSSFIQCQTRFHHLIGREQRFSFSVDRKGGEVCNALYYYVAPLNSTIHGIEILYQQPRIMGSSNKISSHISCANASPTVIGIPDSCYSNTIHHPLLISEQPNILSTGGRAIFDERELYTAAVQGYKWLDLPAFIIQEINPK